MTGIVVGLILCTLSASWALRWLPFISRRLEADEQILFSAALGIFFIAYGVLFAGLIGYLNLKSVSLLILVIAVVALRGFGRLENTVNRAAVILRMRRRPFFYACFFLTGLSVICVLSGTAAPELANDSLCYHLHVPKIFLQIQRIQRIPFEVNSLFPFFMEMLFTVGVVFQSIPLAKFFHLFCGILTAGGIVVAGRRLGTVFSSTLAAFLFLTTPGIVNQLGTTYVDVGLACFSFLSLICYFRWYQTRHNSWLVLCGIMAGSALSIKYLALVGILGVFLLLVFDLRQTKFADCLCSLSAFMIPLALIAGYWYIRPWIELGNPVYPYFYQIFKSGDPGIQYNDIGVSKTLFNFISIPWIMTMKPQIFEGFGDNLGPAYLAFAPLGFGAMGKSPILRRAAFYLLFFTGCWFLLGQSLRFYFPALPAAALFMIPVFDSVSSYSVWARRFFSLAVLMVFVLHAGLAVYHYRGTFPHFVGRMSASDYLRANERSFMPAEFVNAHLPKTAIILNACEVRMFYFERTMIREDIYARDTAYPENYSSKEQIFEALRKDGFTHILLTESVLQNIDQMEPLRVPKILSSGQNSLALSLAPLYTYSFSGPDQPKVVYKLYKL